MAAWLRRNLTQILVLAGIVLALAVGAWFALGQRSLAQRADLAAVRAADCQVTYRSAPVRVRLWLPPGPNGEPGGRDCARIFAAFTPPDGQAPVHVILYAPAWGGLRDQSSGLTRHLAAQGYLVIGIDDVTEEPAPRGETFAERAARQTLPDFASDQIWADSLARGAVRVRLQARKALHVLDTVLAAAAQTPAWRDRIDAAHVGFFGFSIGGAAAADAALLDARIGAIANLDGSLFGEAAARPLGRPYLYMSSDIAAPNEAALNARAPAQRLYARYVRDDLALHARLAAAPGGATAMIRGAVHQSFQDRDTGIQEVRRLLAGPNRALAITSAYVTAFFDANLRGAPQALGDLMRTPPEGVAPLPAVN